MFIYKFVARIVSNNVGRVVFIYVATLIVRGRRIYRKYAFLSRFRGMVFSFGMAGGGINVIRSKTCPELQYCQEQEICYKFNIFHCMKTNCPFYHVCKRCWFVEDISKYHASNDVAKCPNMTDSYRVSMGEGGGGVAPPMYYHYNNQARSPEEVAVGEDLGNRRTSSSSSWLSRLAPEHQHTFSPAESSGIPEEVAAREDLSNRRTSSSSRWVSRLSPENQHTFSPAESSGIMPRQSQSLIEERQESRREGAAATASNTIVGSESNLTPEGAKYQQILEQMKGQNDLLQEERKINESLRKENEKLKQQLQQKENIERENEDLRQKLEEESSRNSKVRVVPMQPYSRLKLVGLPQNTQPKISDHLPNLGTIDIPPLFNKSKNDLNSVTDWDCFNSAGDHVSTHGQENPSVRNFQGSSRGSGPSHRTGNVQPNEDIFNLYNNEENGIPHNDFLSGKDLEYIFRM